MRKLIHNLLPMIAVFSLGGCTLDFPWAEKKKEEEPLLKTELLGSIENAQRSFPFFESKVRARAGSNFRVKLVVTGKNNSQDAIWLSKVRRLEPSTFVGYVSPGQKPLTGHPAGHSIRFTKRQVVDWSFEQDGIQFGAFTQALSPKQIVAQVASAPNP